MLYKLKLINLKCYLSDESDGDEIYILKDGDKVWPSSSKYQTIVDETTELNVSFDIEKGDTLKFDIWDHDKLSANDHLGSLILEATAHGHFENEFNKVGTDRSKYALEWEIG